MVVAAGNVVAVIAVVEVVEVEVVVVLGTVVVVVVLVVVVVATSGAIDPVLTARQPFTPSTAQFQSQSAKSGPPTTRFTTSLPLPYRS